MQHAVLTFVDDLYEDLELWYPKLRLEEAGYVVRLAGPEVKSYSGKHGYPAPADLRLAEVRSADFAGLVIPGGFMPDKLRRDRHVLDLTREFFAQGKMVAFICHGGWIPISAGVYRGVRVTGSLGIKDDLINAGAMWVDEPAFRDGCLVWGRVVEDIPDFCRGILRVITSKKASR